VSSTASEGDDGPAGHRVGHQLQVAIDCADPPELARFWCLALNYIEQPPPPGYDSWDAFADQAEIPVAERFKYGSAIDPAGRGPRLFFRWVPEPKVVKNRLHLDVNVGAGLDGDERKAAVREHAQRLIAAGATLVAERHESMSWWMVLTDPEGNEFCLQ
jgi:hypothetical protein